jgi:hypothetical protein
MEPLALTGEGDRQQRGRQTQLGYLPRALSLLAYSNSVQHVQDGHTGCAAHGYRRSSL